MPNIAVHCAVFACLLEHTHTDCAVIIVMIIIIVTNYSWLCLFLML